MTITRRVRMADLERQIHADLTRLKGRVLQAIEKTAREGVAVVRDNAPEAFGPLRDSVHADGMSLKADAPHAAAVEVGSRPHMPPFKPILEWVRLRGMQGLDGKAAGAPAWVADRIHEQSVDNATPVDAAERVAWAVCRKIAREGTKPTWFVQRSLPAIFGLLDRNIRGAAGDERGE